MNPVLAIGALQRTAAIPLWILPIFLMQQNLTQIQFGQSMMVRELAIFIGLVLGGPLCDGLGPRKAGVAACFVGAIIIALNMGLTYPWMLLVIAISAIGYSAFLIPLQLKVSELFGSKDRLGFTWLKFAKNIGFAVAFAIAAIPMVDASHRIIVFGAALSLACGLAWWRNGCREAADIKTDGAVVSESSCNYPAFLISGVLWGLFWFLFKCSIIIAAAMCQRHYEGASTSVYAQMLLLNTVGCALLVVPFGKWIKKPKVALVVGLFLIVLGFATILSNSVHGIWLGIGILTIGEAIYYPSSEVLLMRNLPSIRFKGMALGFGMLFQVAGSLAGAWTGAMLL